MRLLFLMTVAVALACPAKGQTCTCESNFEWVKKTFEENDAGFQHIIDTKGQAAYDLHNQLMLEKIRASQNLSECLELLSEWLTFFRSCHQWIVPLTDKAPSAAPEKPETWNGNIAQFEEYINTKKEADYEGIWQTGNYKIGVKKENENYIGFIIEADVDGWREQGLVKLKIEQNGDKLKSTWYMRDYSPVVSDEPVLTGNNHLRIGNSALTRVNSTFPDDPLLEKYLKSITSQNPYLEELNENTLYLRIPSFNHSEKKEIDRVIAENEKKILKTENLIIDLRDNGGGSDNSYNKLLPLLYTNPIQTVGVKFLSTELNNQRFLDFAASKEFNFLVRQVFKNYHKKLQRNLGEFVNLQKDTVITYKRNKVYQYPQNVGIIINQGCGSTTEQFLLAARQSTKVRLLGTNTWGCLDISNMYEVASPCNEFELGYGLSRTMRIPDMAIDEIGIEPDYYIDETIPQHKWVEYVNDILKQRKKAE